MRNTTEKAQKKSITMVESCYGPMLLLFALTSCSGVDDDTLDTSPESESTTDSSQSSDHPNDTASDPTYSVDKDVLDAYLAGGFVPIDAGTFVFGSPETEQCRGEDTEKQVTVTLTVDYEMAVTEVTQEMWQAAGFSNPSYPEQASDLPVTYVSWWDAFEFCNRLSEYAGLETCYDLSSCNGVPGKGCLDTMDTERQMCPREDKGLVCSAPTRKFERMMDCPGYRLPTSAEWEYAVRAGTTTATYNGDTLNVLGDCQEFPTLEPIEWYCYNSRNENAIREAQRVAQKQPNPWGLYDTLGNVSEWVDHVYTSWYLESDEGKNGPLSDPMGVPEYKEYELRGARGGNFLQAGCWLRSAFQIGYDPWFRVLYIGLRPVRSLL